MTADKRDKAERVHVPRRGSWLFCRQAAAPGSTSPRAGGVHAGPWWNPAIEDQAMDRVHRLGQTRDVSVVRFCARDTIEERLFELQIRKREPRAAAFKKMSGRAARCAIPTSSACGLMSDASIRPRRSYACAMYVY